MGPTRSQIVRDGECALALPSPPSLPPSLPLFCRSSIASGDWEVEISASTDPEGWTYAMDFFGRYHAERLAHHFVRRRKWKRRCVPTTQGTGVAAASSSSSSSSSSSAAASASSSGYYLSPLHSAGPSSREVSPLSVSPLPGSPLPPFLSSAQPLPTGTLSRGSSRASSQFELDGDEFLTVSPLEPQAAWNAATAATPTHGGQSESASTQPQ